MSFGQSLLIGMFAGNVAKRLSYLAGTTFGLNKAQADSFSDEVGVVAAQAIGTVSALASLDPIGFSALCGYTSLLEHEHGKKSGLQPSQTLKSGAAP